MEGACGAFRLEGHERCAQSRASYTIIEAPSILGLRPSGVERLPDALLQGGLAQGIGARLAGRLTPPPYDPERDPNTLTLNAQAIARFSPQLADAVGATLDRGEFPLVLGGDCSILLGSVLALRARPVWPALRRRACGFLPAGSESQR